MRYHSNFDVLELIRTAKKELARSKPEQCKVFLLAVMAGLRLREIDTTRVVGVPVAVADSSRGSLFFSSLVPNFHQFSTFSDTRN